MEPSLTDPGRQDLLCQYLNIYADQSLSLSTALYVGGSSCADNSATPALMETLSASVSSESLVNLTLPLSDNTQSDILGVFDLDPTEDTLQRYVACHCQCILTEQ